MSEQGTATISNQSRRLPIALAGAALLSFAGLFFTAERFLGLPILALLLVCTYMTQHRLPATGRMRWVMRAFLFVALAAIVGVPRGDIPLWYMKPEYTNVIGIVLAAELVFRAWERPQPGELLQKNGVILFITAMIITAASNTYDRQPMQSIIPFYILLLALALRSIVKSGQPKPPTAKKRTTLAPLLALRGAALLLAMSAGFVVVFLLTRYDNRLTSWAIEFLRQDKAVKGSSIGLNSAPHLRRIFNPQPSMERVLQIDGSASERHLRVMVFDGYEKAIWSPSASARSFTLAPAQSLGIDRGGPKLQIRSVSDAVDVLAIPSDAAAIQGAGQLETEDLGAFREHDPGLHPAFSVVLQNVRRAIPLAVAPDAAKRARALIVPTAIDPQVIALAKKVAGDAAPLQRVQRIQQYLASHHQYSLSYDPGTDEPLNDFLLNGRAAHCQYFASAVVMMARAAGVPARLATGYYAHERFGDNQLIVRDRDAHAWAECWIDGQGWITIDATPASGRPDGAFDEASKLRQWWEWFTDLPGRFRRWLIELPRQTLMMLIVAAAAVIGLIWLARVVRKRRLSKKMSADGYLQPGQELALAGRRFEQWLRRQNVPCAANRTWREHLAALSQQSSSIIDATAPLHFIETYDRARFGNVAQLIAQLKTALDQLEQTPAQPGSRQHG